MARRAAGSHPAARIKDHYRTVGEDLIRRMREGTAPWTEAWQPRWGTFRQVRDLGGHVRRGRAVHEDRVLAVRAALPGGRGAVLLQGTGVVTARRFGH